MPSPGKNAPPLTEFSMNGPLRTEDLQISHPHPRTPPDALGRGRRRPGPGTGPQRIGLPPIPLRRPHLLRRPSPRRPYPLRRPYLGEAFTPNLAEARRFRLLPRLPGLSYTRTLWRYVIASRTALLPARAPPDRPSHRNSLWAPYQRRCTQNRRSSGKRWAARSPGRPGSLSRSIRLLKSKLLKSKLQDSPTRRRG